MRIAVIAPGSRGDVQPYIALGKGLLNAGHVVRLITHQDFASLVSNHGLDFWPMGGGVQEIVADQEMRARVEGGNFLLLMAQMAKEAERRALDLAEGGLSACQGMDMVLAGLGGLYIGLALAEKMHLPLLQAYYLPFTPTQAYASVLTPDLPGWLGGSLNRLSHHLTRQVMWQSFRAADNRARRDVLELAGAPFWGPYNSEALQGLPILYGYSPALIPPAPDWVGRHHVTGFWFLESEKTWSPPANLLEFLDSGPPPVCIGFGSMSNKDPIAITDLVLEALNQSCQRAILLTGWGGLQADERSGSVFFSDAIPHDWLFPRVAAVVHHGGVGTTAAGLRAGVPSIVIPFFGDQPFWGQMIASKGVGPKPIPRKKLTPQRLASAIRQAVSDESMRQRAAVLGAEIRAEDGIQRAVEIVNQI
jgi:sterol 3beta-glucosyltransferase